MRSLLGKECKEIQERLRKAEHVYSRMECFCESDFKSEGQASHSIMEVNVL